MTSFALRGKVIEFFKDYSFYYLNLNTKQTSKQMLQSLPIALAPVKAGNNSENLSNEIRQIVYSLYQSK